MLGEGDAFYGGAFLRIDGLVSSDGVVDEGGDGGGVLDADDGERVGVEGVLAGIGVVRGDAIGGGCHRSSCSMRREVGMGSGL
jgi:hypothetical protein